MLVMKALKFRNRSYLLFAAAFLLFIFPFTDLGFDQIHEGINIGSALGLINGDVIHRDFIEMKGLVFPVYLMVASSFNVTHAVLAMKYANILLIALSAIFTYVSTKDLNASLARIFVLLWLITNPITSNFTYHSINGTLMISANNLTVAVVLLIALLTYCVLSKELAGRNQLLLIITIAILNGILPWIRVQNIFFAFVFCLWFAVTQKKRFLIVANFIFSLLLSLLTPFILLCYHGAAYSWAEQIFVFPFLLNRLGDSSTYIPLSILSKTFIVCLVYLFLFIFFSYTLVFFRKFLFLPYAFLISLAPFALFLSNNFEIDEKKNLDLRNWLIILSNNWPNSWARSLIPLAFFAIITLAVNYLLNKTPRSTKLHLKFSNFNCLNFESSFDKRYFPFLIAGGQGLLYLYPNFGNLWEISPLLILPSMIFLSSVNRTLMKKVSTVLTLVLIGLSSTSTFKALEIYLSPKSAYVVTPLSGISDLNKSTVESFNRVMNHLGKLNGKIRNECNLSLVSFPKGEFRSDSKYYVNLPYKKVIPEELLMPEILVTCASSESNLNLSEYSLNAEFSLQQDLKLYVYLKK